MVTEEAQRHPDHREDEHGSPGFPLDHAQFRDESLQRLAYLADLRAHAGGDHAREALSLGEQAFPRRRRAGRRLLASPLSARPRPRSRACALALIRR